MARLILMNKINLLRASKEVKIEAKIGTEGSQHDNEFKLESFNIIFS